MRSAAGVLFLTGLGAGAFAATRLPTTPAIALAGVFVSAGALVWWRPRPGLALAIASAPLLLLLSAGFGSAGLMLLGRRLESAPLQEPGNRTVDPTLITEPAPWSAELVDHVLTHGAAYEVVMAIVAIGSVLAMGLAGGGTAQNRWVGLAVGLATGAGGMAAAMAYGGVSGTLAAGGTLVVLGFWLLTGGTPWVEDRRVSE